MWVARSIVVTAALLSLLDFRVVDGFALRNQRGESATTSSSLPSMRGSSTSALRMALSEERLLELTKDLVANSRTDKFGDNYVFRGPVIGPLSKKDLGSALGELGPGDSFDDFNVNAFGYCVDPIEENRVWYFVRPRGRFTKPYKSKLFGTIEPNFQELIAPPEARSVVWNDDETIKYGTVGYVTDRFTGDTTDGLGAVMGVFRHMGIQIDGSIGSWKTILLQKLATILPDGTVPLSYSREEDIPDWWTDPRRGAEK